MVHVCESKGKERRKLRGVSCLDARGWNRSLYRPHDPSATQTCSNGATGLAPIDYTDSVQYGIASRPVRNGGSSTGACICLCLSSSPDMATQTDCHRHFLHVSTLVCVSSHRGGLSRTLAPICTSDVASHSPNNDRLKA